MARIVFGMASSRSPLMAAPPEFWQTIGDRDQFSRRLRDTNGNSVTYEELLAKAPASMANEITLETYQRKYAASQKAFATCVQKLADADPDIIVFMGDDEEEYIHEDNRPGIMVYRGETWLNIPRAVNEADPVSKMTSWQWGREEKSYPIATDLTTHVLKSLIEAEFDMGDSLTLKAMAHGFGFMYERLLTKRIVPMVPIIINVHTPPNQPTPRRCYMLGRAIRNAVEAWPGDARVAVIGSGGLSVGVLEEACDRAALTAIQNRDIDAITKLPRGWIQGSTGEVLCWIATGGALEHLQMTIEDYVPAYRSAAGTGTGLGFATWS